MHELALRRDGGFTLFELMAVVMILGILITIAIATYTVSTASAQRVTCQSNQRMLNDAVTVYEQNHSGALPTTVDDLKPYISMKNFGHCPSDPSVAYTIDATTGVVTCPIHPPQ